MRTAIVTGAARGIGAEIGRHLARDGVRVAFLDLDGDEAAEIAGSVDGLGLTCDVSSRESVDRAIARVMEEFGQIDIAVNNAGISGSAEETLRRSEAMEAFTSELLERQSVPTTALNITTRTTDEDWRRMFAVHVDGTFFVTRAVLPDMIARGAGSIVNVASVCGLVGCIGSPAYSAAKAAIVGFSRSLAKEVGNQGVRVNVVAPGYIDTAITPVRSTTERNLTIAQVPMGRLGTPAEVAECVTFLASDRASYFTGAVLSPNGGVFAG